MEMIEVQPKELAAYRNPVAFLALVREGGEIVKKAGMFGCKTVEQGQMMMMLSVTEGLSFKQINERYHLMEDGKLAMKADYMRTKLRAMGGDYDWIKDGDDGIEAKLWIEYRGRRREVSYTIDHAKKEGLIRAGSRWVKAPGDMLRARCSTKAVRMVASEVLSGFYTPEELDEGEDDDSEIIEGTFEVVPAATKAAPKSNGKSSTAAQPAKEQPKAETAAVPATQTAEVEYCNGEQSSKITGLCGELNLTPEQIEKAITKRGGNGTQARTLTKKAADELIAVLTSALDQKMAKAKEQPKQYHNGPCTPEMAAEAKQLLQEMNQVKPGAADRFVSRMNAFELNPDGSHRRIKDLSYADCAALIEAIKARNLDLFFTRDIEAYWKRSMEDHPAEPIPTNAEKEASAKN